MTVKSNVKLDARIKSMDDIQTCVQYDDKYIGEYGYFSDSISEFSDLDSCTRSVLAHIDEMGGTDMIFDDNENYYRFFLPESLLKEVEYRPFTKDEFIRMFNNGVFGQWITMKSINPEKEYHLQFTGYYTAYNDLFVCLGSMLFSLNDMFKNYKWKDSNGNWRVFGVEVKDVE